MDNDNLKLSLILFRIFIVADIVLFLLFFTTLLLAHKASGTSLTDYFIEDLRLYYIFSSIRTGSIFSLLFMLTATVIVFLPLGFENFRSTPAYKVFAGVVMSLIIAIASIAAPLGRVVPVIFNRPVIANATVVDKDQHYGGSRHHRHWIYTLYFSNGVQRTVSEPLYNQSPVDCRFYLVMCGSEAIGVYPASEYTIPSTSSYLD